MTAKPATSVAVRARLALAWAAVAWERLWIGLWPVATFLAFVLALALTDVLPSLPAWLHLIVLIGAAAVAGLLGWRGLRVFAWPKRAEARACRPFLLQISKSRDSAADPPGSLIFRGAPGLPR